MVKSKDTTSDMAGEVDDRVHMHHDATDNILTSNDSLQVQFVIV